MWVDTKPITSFADTPFGHPTIDNPARGAETDGTPGLNGRMIVIGSISNCALLFLPVHSLRVVSLMRIVNNNNNYNNHSYRLIFTHPRPLAIPPSPQRRGSLQFPVLLCRCRQASARIGLLFHFHDGDHQTQLCTCPAESLRHGMTITRPTCRGPCLGLLLHSLTLPSWIDRDSCPHDLILQKKLNPRHHVGPPCSVSDWIYVHIPCLSLSPTT